MNTLSELAELQTRLIENMQTDDDWEQMEPLVKSLHAVNVESVAKDIVPHLLESFVYWTQEKMTGAGGQEPLGAVVFEWTAEDEQSYFDGDLCEAGAYGFGGCVEKAGNVFIPRPEYDLSASRFDYCGGIPLDTVIKHSSPDGNTKFTDLLIFTVAEVLHHAIARAIEHDVFVKLNRSSELLFLVSRHDRWAAKSYHWRR